MQSPLETIFAPDDNKGPIRGHHHCEPSEENAPNPKDHPILKTIVERIEARKDRESKMVMRSRPRIEDLVQQIELLKPLLLSADPQVLFKASEEIRLVNELINEIEVMLNIRELRYCPEKFQRDKEKRRKLKLKKLKKIWKNPEARMHLPFRPKS